MMSVENLRETAIYMQVARVRYMDAQDVYRNLISQVMDPEILRLAHARTKDAQCKLGKAVTRCMDALELYERENGLG